MQAETIGFYWETRMARKETREKARFSSTNMEVQLVLVAPRRARLILTQLAKDLGKVMKHVSSNHTVAGCTQSQTR